jgi:hypothetical protein
MLMIIIEPEEREENKKPLLIDIMYAKRRNTFNEKRIETKNRGSIDFFMRHVMSFIIDMFEEKKKGEIDMKKGKRIKRREGKTPCSLDAKTYIIMFVHRT